MDIAHFFQMDASQLATGRAFESVPEQLHEPLVTAIELRFRCRGKFALDLSARTAGVLDEILASGRDLPPERAAGLVRAVGCYFGTLLVQHCDAQYVEMVGYPVFVSFPAAGVMTHTSPLRMAIDAWEQQQPRFADALEGLIDHIREGRERPLFVPVYDFRDVGPRMRPIWLLAHSLQAVFGRFVDGHWNLIYVPQTLQLVDELIAGQLDAQMAVRLETVAAAPAGTAEWQARACAAFFGELVRQHLGGRWIQPERGPLEMDLGLTDTLFSPIVLCRNAVAGKLGDYPLLRSFQDLMDFKAEPGSRRFPLENVQMEITKPDEDPLNSGIEATATWNIAMLQQGLGAATPTGGTANIVSDELPTNDTRSPLAMPEVKEYVTRPIDIELLEDEDDDLDVQLDASFSTDHSQDAGSSTRQYSTDELQRMLVDSEDKKGEGGSTTREYDVSELAAAFAAAPQSAEVDLQEDAGASTRKYNVNELQQGLRTMRERTGSLPRLTPEDDVDVGASTRQYRADELAAGLADLYPTGEHAFPENPYSPPTPPPAYLPSEDEDATQASFDAETLYNQLMDDPSLNLGAGPGAGGAVIQTMEEWSTQRTEHNADAGPLAGITTDAVSDPVETAETTETTPQTKPVMRVNTPTTDPDAGRRDLHEARTQDVSLKIPEIARLRVSKQKSNAVDLDAVRHQLLPVLVPPDWERMAQVVARPVLEHLPDSPMLTIAIDYPDKLVYINAGDIEAWESTFDILLSMAQDNLTQASQDLASRFTRVDTDGDMILQLNTGDYFEASRILLPALGRAAEQLLGVSDVWVAIPNRNILLLTTTGHAGQLQSFASVARYCYQEKEFQLSPRVYFYGAPGPRLQREVE